MYAVRMAVHRKTDREKRRAWRAYHASGMHAAKNHYFYSDPEDGDHANIVESWHIYLSYMESESQPHVQFDKFVEELRVKQR